MPKITRTALVSHAPEQMFDLVNDFSAYPDFLPWCSGARVLSASETEIIGELTIQKGAIRQIFSTRNTLTRPSRIDLSLVDGPFRALSGHWQFEAVGDNACRVSLELEFEFAGRLIAMAIGAVFSQIAGSLVDAFCDRADQLYGPGHAG
jgi:ribosome-associated toxin RatA of RatAB toxin-antitoxin module